MTKILPARDHPATGIPAERARVRPRIISPITGEAIPLDDEIGLLIQEGRYRFVGLSRRAGFGQNHRIAPPGGRLTAMGVGSRTTDG